MIVERPRLRDVTLGKEQRQHAAVELRRLEGWSKVQMREFYDQLIHHEKLKLGRSLVDALRQAGR